MKINKKWRRRISNTVGLFFVPVMLLVNSSQVLARVPSLSNPNLQQINRQAYVLVGDMDRQTVENQGFNSNITFFITRSSVVVVDPGSSARIGRMAINEIKKITNKPVTHVINSHFHPDHWLGNQAFSELMPPPKIIAHPNMKVMANKTSESAIKRLNNLTKGAHADTRAVLPNTLVNGGEELNIGGLTFKLIHPRHAHTTGDLMVYVPELKTIVTGDVFFYKRTPGLQHASTKGNAQALDKLIELDIDHVIPGHGPITNKHGLNYMRNYLSLLYKEVKKYYDLGLTDRDMMEKINVGMYRDMSGFENRFPVNVNAMYQQVVQEAGHQLFLKQIGVNASH
ncbi:MBL fold metallo-hydrolase [Sulfuriflexus mobilis]|uniref:MBL fold metallo-hydrolase n=1 Tax=Sulfuriflexus mobilis TaxID=1811807 RepID=UPI000F8211F9|nr:MBL fold metallo-hydrolase [Sulfuriflexus mobilis]